MKTILASSSQLIQCFVCSKIPKIKENTKSKQASLVDTIWNAFPAWKSELLVFYHDGWNLGIKKIGQHCCTSRFQQNTFIFICHESTENKIHQPIPLTRTRFSPIMSLHVNSNDYNKREKIRPHAKSMQRSI